MADISATDVKRLREKTGTGMMECKNALVSTEGDFNKALYSIIFQFTSTMILNSLYRACKLQTMAIITSRPDEVYSLIREMTNHAVTALTGKGLFDAQDNHRAS